MSGSPPNTEEGAASVPAPGGPVVDCGPPPPAAAAGDAATLPIRFVSVATRGFGRGSKDLGIPTANLDRDQTTTDPPIRFEDLPSGVYWGLCRILDAGGANGSSRGGDDVDDADNTDVYYSTRTAAVSIGFNPTYGNDVKTVEPHLIAPPGHRRRHASSCGETVFRDFYGRPLRLTICGYLRPNAPFEGLEPLIAAIKQDIRDAEALAASGDETVARERAWVDSDEALG